MAIAYKSAGAGGGTETSGAQLALACPAVVAANDILIAHVTHEGLTTAPTDPAGWTLLYGPANLGTGTAIGRSWAYGKLADGTEDGATVNFGTEGGTGGRYGRIYSFDGYVSGTLAQIIPAASFTDIPTEGSIPLPSVDTSVVGAMAVALLVQDDNNAFAAASGESGGSWAEPVAEFVSTTLGVQGCVVGIQTCIPTTDPGRVTGGTANATADEGSTIGFEIRPQNGPGFVRQTGAVTAGVSTPDHASLDITGDIDLRFAGRLNDWTPAATEGLVSKWFSDHSYLFRVETTGVLVLQWKTAADGFESANSTAAVPFADGEDGWVRVTLDVDNGATQKVATFYTSAEPIDTAPAAVTWNILGTAVTTAGTTNIKATTVVPMLGIFDNTSGDLQGLMHYAEIRNGIAGTIVANPDFRYDCQQDSATQLTDDQSRVWTITSPAIWGTPLPCPVPSTFPLPSNVQQRRTAPHLAM